MYFLSYHHTEMYLFCRRIKKLDPSSGLVDETSTWKLDLYFQQYSGQQLHSSLESVLKQVMADVKVLDTPPYPSVSGKLFNGTETII